MAGAAYQKKKIHKNGDRLLEKGSGVAVNFFFLGALNCILQDGRWDATDCDIHS